MKGFDAHDAIMADRDAAAAEIKKVLDQIPAPKGEVIDLFPYTEKPGSEADYLRAVDGSDFWTIEIPEIKWAVPEILKEGLGVLLGAQKLGKSTLVTDMALAIATGGRFLNNFHVDKGAVLYLNYEDSLNDLRDRARALGYNNTKEGFPRLRVEFDAPRQDGGGMDLIRKWAEGCPDRRLLIIDPLVKFRRFRRPDEKGLDAYQLDYAVIGEVHALAKQLGFSVLVIHHESKAPNPDWVLKGSGSVALTAAAGTVIRLDRKRERFDARLTITGRGIKDKILAVKGDGLTWRYCGDAEEFECSQNIISIKSLLRRQGEMSLKDIAETLEIPRNTVKSILYRNSGMADSCFYQSTDRKRWGALTPKEEKDDDDD